MFFKMIKLLYDKNFGVDLVENYNRVSDKDWLIAFLLCFFAGFLGLHRFYCGKIASGIVYILTVGGFFGVGVLIDLILIVCKKFKDSEGLYLKKCFLE